MNEEWPLEGVQLEQPRKPLEEQVPAEVLGDERDCPCRRERAPQARTSGLEVTQVVELVQAAEGVEELAKRHPWRGRGGRSDPTTTAADIGMD
jgi:hypothetical protein